MASVGQGNGGCMCGKVRFELATAPTEYSACHCNMCRKFSGGIELGVHVDPGGLTWISDDTLKTYASSEWAERGFCENCGSSLFWRLTAPGPAQGMLSLSAGALDSIEGMKFTTEVYIDNKPPSHGFAGDDRTQMTEADVMEMVAKMGADSDG